MLKPKIALRLAVTLVAAFCIVLCLAYWWQDNRTHEVVGIAFLALLGRHIYVIRVWFLNLRRGTYDARRWLGVLLQSAVALNVALLAITSVLISQWAFAPLSLPSNVTVRDLHWLSAYWLVIIVGMHVGLQWTKVMQLLRSGLRITGRSTVRTIALRFLAAALSALGIWSLWVLEVGTKLSWNFSLNFWDFSTSVWPFFVHWAAVMALPAIATHYGLKLVPQQTARRPA